MTQTTKPLIIPASLEADMHRLVNAERRRHSLPELYWDAALSDIARAHSQDMAVRGFSGHVNPDGLDPTGRARFAGYPVQKRVGNTIYMGVAENIHWTDLFESSRELVNYTEYPGGQRVVTGRRTTYNWYSPAELAALTVNGWMNSSGHRRNILTPHYQREGIGAALHGDRAYITQNFF